MKQIKDDALKAPKKELKSIYIKIINGYTEIETSFGQMYIKHIDTWASGEVDDVYQEHLDKAKGQGLPTEEEQTEFLQKEEIWTKKEEQKLTDLDLSIRGMRSTKGKLYLDSQIEQINKEIDEAVGKANDLRKEKMELMGFTAEAYASKKLNEFYMYTSLYKDKEFKNLFFSEEAFEDVSFQGLHELMSKYNQATKYYIEINLKRISLSPFFLNYFYLCDDNPMTFFGKPVIKLTYLQAEMFGYARYFKNLLSQAKNQPTDDLYEEPERLVEFLEGQKNAEKLQHKMGNLGKDYEAASVVGATSKDLKTAGIEAEGKGRDISLTKEAAKKGGLDMQDLIKLHGA